MALQKAPPLTTTQNNEPLIACHQSKRRLSIWTVGPGFFFLSLSLHLHYYYSPPLFSPPSLTAIYFFLFFSLSFSFLPANLVYFGSRRLSIYSPVLKMATTWEKKETRFLFLFLSSSSILSILIGVLLIARQQLWLVLPLREWPRPDFPFFFLFLPFR
jgi:hypothetical protein